MLGTLFLSRSSRDVPSRATTASESDSDPELLESPDWEHVDQADVLSVTKSFPESQTDHHDAGESQSTKLSVDCIFLPLIGQVSMAANTFHARCDLDLSWPATTDDEKRFAADSKAFEPSFCPQLVVQNAMEVEVSNVPGSNGNPFSIQQGKVKVRIKFNGTFLQRFEVAAFPFDIQELSMIFSLSFTDVTQARFEIPKSGDFFLIPTQSMALSEFEVLSLHAGVGIEASFSHLYATVVVRREWKSYVISIAIYAALLNFSCLAAFFCQEIDNQVGVIITLMLSLMALLFVSSSMVPRSFDVSLLDRYMLTSFIYMLVELIILIGDSNRQGAGKDRYGLLTCATLALAHLLYFVSASMAELRRQKRKLADPQRLFLPYRKTLPTFQCAMAAAGALT